MESCNNAFACTICRYLLRVYIEGKLGSAVLTFLPLAQMDSQWIGPVDAFFDPLPPWVPISPDVSCLTALRHGSNPNGLEKGSQRCRPMVGVLYELTAPRAR